MKGATSDFISANFTDTGQWKLIVYVSAHGICALLKNTELPELPPVTLLSRSWSCPVADVLPNIEAAVYDNPRMLDDYATEIIVCTPKALWIPSALMEDEEFDPRWFSAVYPAADEDISMEYGSMESVLFSLVPGLNSFLRRTLPGCRVSSHLSVLKSLFRRLSPLVEPSPASGTVFVNVREGEADFFVFKDRRFFCGAVHPWSTHSDIAYFVTLVAEANALELRSLNLNVVADGATASGVAACLEPYVASISLWSRPDSVDREGLPLAAAVAVGDSISLLL